MSPASRRLVSINTKKGIARTRIVHCPECGAPLDRYSLKKAPAVSTATTTRLPKKATFKIRVLPTPAPRVTPEPSPDRYYALYRVDPNSRLAVRVDGFVPTTSMAQALVALKAAQGDGETHLQVHWLSSSFAPSSVEFPAYLTHIVES